MLPEPGNRNVVHCKYRFDAHKPDIHVQKLNVANLAAIDTNERKVRAIGDSEHMTLRPR